MHDDDWADEPLARGQAGESRGPDEPTDPADSADRADPGDPESAEDAAWREIVANFGERAVLDDEPPTPTAEDTPFVVRFSNDRDDHADQEDRSAPQDYFLGEPIDLDSEERYLPPPPPPLPRTTPARFLAWLGVLGTPVVAVLLVTIHAVTGFIVPSWLIAFLVVGFLGGFGYLLATMSREPGDPWDDGARV